MVYESIVFLVISWALGTNMILRFCQSEGPKVLFIVAFIFISLNINSPHVIYIVITNLKKDLYLNKINHFCVHSEFFFQSVIVLLIKMSVLIQSFFVLLFYDFIQYFIFPLYIFVSIFLTKLPYSKITVFFEYIYFFSIEFVFV